MECIRILRGRAYRSLINTQPSPIFQHIAGLGISSGTGKPGSCALSGLFYCNGFIRMDFISIPYRGIAEPDFSWLAPDSAITYF